MSTARDWIELNLPDRRAFARFVGWSFGRLCFSGSLLTITVARSACKLGIWLCDSSERSIKNLLKVYDQLPYSGTVSHQLLEASAVTLPTEPLEIITDAIAFIEGKQVMIIGEMGTGKSTLAQYLAYTVGGRVKVLEPEGTPDDWSGLEVIGKGEDWEAIDESMASDLQDLTSQIQLRNEKGDSALAGTERVIIAEEYPEIRHKCSNAEEWLDRHARRGRKARRFLILLSQYDRVSAWGLEGKSDLADAFHRIRLGKKAVAHAKSLKDDALVEWLRSDRSHCLIDDQPCKLPSYREMKAVIPRLHLSPVSEPIVTAEPVDELGLQPPDFPVSSYDETLSRAVKACLDAGFSESRVIKEILGCQGSRYQEGKALLQRMRGE